MAESGLKFKFPAPSVEDEVGDGDGGGNGGDGSGGGNDAGFDGSGTLGFLSFLRVTCVTIGSSTVTGVLIFVVAGLVSRLA